MMINHKHDQCLHMYQYHSLFIRKDNMIKIGEAHVKLGALCILQYSKSNSQFRKTSVSPDTEYPKHVCWNACFNSTAWSHIFFFLSALPTLVWTRWTSDNSLGISSLQNTTEERYPISRGDVIETSDKKKKRCCIAMVWKVTWSTFIEIDSLWGKKRD